METIPEVPKCFGVFPPHVAAYFISIFGLSTGGFVLTSIVLYGLAEDSFVDHFIQDEEEKDVEVKKIVLLTLGMSNILLFTGSALLFVGIAFKQERTLLLSGWIIFGMCFFLIVVAIAVPCGCFFTDHLCALKKVSSGEYALTYIVITVFLWLWIYFMAVIFNYLNTLV